MQDTARKKSRLINELMIDFPYYDPKDDDSGEDRTLRTLRLMREGHKQQRARLLARHLRESERWKKDAMASIDFDATEFIANMPGSPPTMMAASIKMISTPEAEKALGILPPNFRSTLVSIKQLDRTLELNPNKIYLDPYKVAGMIGDVGAAMRQRMVQEEQDLRYLQEVEKAPYYEVLRRQDPQRHNAKEGMNLSAKPATNQPHRRDSVTRVPVSRQASGSSRGSTGSITYPSGSGATPDPIGQRGGPGTTGTHGMPTLKSRDPRPRPSPANVYTFRDQSTTGSNQPDNPGNRGPSGHVFDESSRPPPGLRTPGFGPPRESPNASPMNPASPTTSGPFDRRNSSASSQAAVINDLMNVPKDSGEAAYLKRLLMTQQQQHHHHHQQQQY